MKSDETLPRILTAAVNNLLSGRSRRGHWQDVRSTSLAVWALNDCLMSCPPLPPSLSFIASEIEQTSRWLYHQAKPEKPGCSWESEAWDTALSIIALADKEFARERIDQAAHWLDVIKDEKTGVWYDEVWETTLSSIALLRMQRIRKTPVRNEDWSWIEAVFGWLCEIPSKASGEFVCPHYSGFLVWLLGEVLNSPAAGHISKSITFQSFKKKTDRALKWLLDELDSAHSNLWSPYTFSISYIVIGLCSLNIPLRSTRFRALIHWFEEQQCDGGFEDIEDTSLAVIALSSLARQANVNMESILERVPRPTTTKKCFIGYSGKAHPIALALKEHISIACPGITFIDWKLNFRLGHILIEEIIKACNESDAAIFLITKDDRQFTSAKSSKRTPRDNIVFEYGYFSAKIGIENTILIVEGKTKLPSDLGGVLYIPMSSRKSLDGVKAVTTEALKRVLHL